MSLGDHDTFSMHGCPVAVRGTFLPTDDGPLRRAIVGAGYPIIASEGATETAIYLLGGVRHLRHGLTERGIPIGTRAGFAAAPSTAALAEIDRLHAVGRELADGLADRGVPLDGVDGYVCRWTDRCSGCSVGYEGGGGYDKAGAGCFECGYTGKRRREHWEPLPTGGAS